MNTVNKLVHFGWKKEAIPITQTKKTLLGKLFEAIFRLNIVIFRNISCFKKSSMFKYNIFA